MSAHVVTHHINALNRTVDKVLPQSLARAKPRVQMGHTKETIVALGEELRKRGETEVKGRDLTDDLEKALRDCIASEHIAKTTGALLKDLKENPRLPEARKRLQDALNATLETPFEYDDTFQRFQKKARGVIIDLSALVNRAVLSCSYHRARCRGRRR